MKKNIIWMTCLMVFLCQIFLPINIFAKEVDLKVKGIGLGSTYAKTIKQLGKPLKIKKKGPEVGCDAEELETELIANYSGLVIKFMGDGKGKNFRVYSMIVTSDKWLVEPNVKIGADSKTVKAKLGKTDSHKDGDFQVLSYVISGNDGFAAFYFKNDKLVKIEWMYELC